MQIRVLGHLEANVGDRPVPLGGAKQRAVLAMLGLEAGHAVTADRLIEGLWGEEPPASAAKMVQNYVWRLRRALDGEDGAEIVTRGRAYELCIDRELVDAWRLERLVSEAVRAAEAGEPASAAREALALFRGDPLADVADEPFAGAEIRRLEELRRTAAELAVEADLAAGHHQELVAEIDALLAEDPLRERLHALRMLALYRCGRQAAALEAYREARATLVESVGVEPSAELRRLHEAILRQDPSLDVEPAAAELPRELDAAASPPLIGRDGELDRLRARWRRAAEGAGALVTLVGAYGMGKTRVAAELAAEAHREGATVIYAAGTGAPEAALAALARLRASPRRTLVVVDDADRAPVEVRLALRDLGAGLAHLPALVVATGQEVAALGRLEPRETVVLEALGATPSARSRGCTRPRARRRRWTRCSPPASGSRARCTRRRGSGRAARPRAASTTRRPGPPPGGPRRARWRPSWRAAWSSSSPPASARRSPPATRTPSRSCAPTRGWPPMRARTRSTSSGASGWWRSSCPGSSGRRCWPSSARRGAASPRSCAPGCCPRSPAACCPAARAGRRR